MNYTSIEQSKKLAKILPLESADMYYRTNIKGIGIVSNIPTIGKRITEWDIPCWSLSALLGVIPQEIYEGKYIIDNPIIILLRT